MKKFAKRSRRRRTRTRRRASCSTSCAGLMHQYCIQCICIVAHPNFHGVCPVCDVPLGSKLQYLPLARSTTSILYYTIYKYIEIYCTRVTTTTAVLTIVGPTAVHPESASTIQYYYYLRTSIDLSLESTRVQYRYR